MYLLISTEQNSHFSVAVGGQKIEKIKTVEKPYKQSEFLLKTIKEVTGNETRVTRNLKTRIQDSRFTIHGIMVVKGPGAFSALRIGIATANALSYSWKVPVVGVELQNKQDKLDERDKLEEIWIEGMKLLKTAKKGFVSPVYGKEPNITLKKN